MTDRRLVLIRHAKAEATGSSDSVRALAARGRRDAPAIGRWLAAQGIAFVVADHDDIGPVGDDGPEAVGEYVAQVREATARLMRGAKQRRIALFIVGHVTKDGTLAGRDVVHDRRRVSRRCCSNRAMPPSPSAWMRLTRRLR